MKKTILSIFLLLAVNTALAQGQHVLHAFYFFNVNNPAGVVAAMDKFKSSSCGSQMPADVGLMAETINGSASSTHFFIVSYENMDDFSEAQEDGEYIDGYLYGVKGASGIKGSYRKYRNGDAKGLFYQANLRLLNYSWGYKMNGEDWKDVNTFVYNPSLVLGYKYHPPILNKRLFVEVFAGAGYSYDDPKDGDVKLKFLDDEDDPASAEEAGSNDFGPDFNVYIGFTF